MSHPRIRAAAVAVAVGAAAVLLLVGEGLALPLAAALVCPLVVLVVVDDLWPGWSGQAAPGHPEGETRPSHA